MDRYAALMKELQLPARNVVLCKNSICPEMVPQSVNQFYEGPIINIKRIGETAERNVFLALLMLHIRFSIDAQFLFRFFNTTVILLQRIADGEYFSVCHFLI